MNKYLLINTLWNKKLFQLKISLAVGKITVPEKLILIINLETPVT